MQLILGMGATGVSIARFLHHKKTSFVVFDDQQTNAKIAKFAAHPPLDYYFGKTSDLDFSQINQAIVSPGIAQSHPLIQELRQKNIDIISDIDLFSQYAKATVIGVTGSNGKSSVVHLLTKMATDQQISAVASGNIGVCALDALLDNPDAQLYVLELSSYQLDYLHSANLAVAVVLNITPDHLDRYPDFDSYKQSKLNIYKHTKQPVCATDQDYTPLDGATCYGLVPPQQAQQFGTVVCHGSRYLLQGDEVLCTQNELKLLGIHNISNALACLAVGDILGWKITGMTQTLKEFSAIEHRLEQVTTQKNITYYNDSKSTNVCSSMCALEAVKTKHPDQNIVLIMGGIAKQEDYQPLADLASQYCQKIILIGQSTPELLPLFQPKTTKHTATLADAVLLTQQSLSSGVVLFSPACASFDMFNNFAHRGEAFKEALNK